MFTLLFRGVLLVAAIGQSGQSRPAREEAERDFWLRNMIVYHAFSDEEAADVLALRPEEVKNLRERLGLTPGSRPPDRADGTPTIQPYPGGRHPRIGFLEGAIDPQRETKVSIFTPWDRTSYVVVDAPEAVWSNLGLTYLAHTHVRTIWEERNIRLPRMEWERLDDGSLRLERRLPNGIVLGTKVEPRKGYVYLEEWMENGTEEQLTDLRVQNCVMLKAAEGFADQTNENKVFRPPYVAVGNRERSRWIITGWEPIQRAWANPPVPCLHADPRFPDCPPGETRHVVGIVRFFEGVDLDAELKRLDTIGWKGKLDPAAKDERPRTLSAR